MVSVHVEGLTKRFAGQLAISEVSIAIPSGSFVTLLGPSGCGKTTTLRCIAGLEAPDQGLIVVGERTFFDGRRGIFVPPERRKLGMVFQSYALWPHMTVAQNVAYPLRRQRWAQADVTREVNRILDLVNLRTQRDRSVAALSGGQQQRVALARAMVGDPALTLFDEPLSNLDVKLRDRMRSEIRQLHDRIGMTSIYVTHDQEEAFALSDMVVVMNDGRIQQIGTPQELYFRPANSFVADFVGFENRLAAQLRIRADKSRWAAFPSGAELGVTEIAAEPGDDLAVFARPRALSLTPAPGRLEIAKGRVVGLTYLGEGYEVQVETELGTVTGYESPGEGVAAPTALSEEVAVFLDARQSVVLPAESAS